MGVNATMHFCDIEREMGERKKVKYCESKILTFFNEIIFSVIITVFTRNIMECNYMEKTKYNKYLSY